MMEKEKATLTINCEVCDTTKMKKEDYCHYERITINAELIVVNETTKNMLNHLPITMNIEQIIDSTADEIEFMTVNGSHEITSQSRSQSHTILIVNGYLKILPGAKETANTWKGIVVNGCAEFPKSLEDSFNKMVINGSSKVYPDDCIILDDDFTIDRYFPIAAKENTKYYARNMVVVKDTNVDIASLTQKNVQIVSPLLLVAEEKLEDCICLFEDNTKFIVIPSGLALVLGDTLLDDALLLQYGARLFVYGNLRLDENTELDAICGKIEELAVTGTVSLYCDQSEAFQKINARYDKIEFRKRERHLHNMLEIKLDKTLFDHSPDGINICDVVKVEIADDVTPEMILDKLSVTGCSRIDCNMEQESALCAIGVDLGKLRNFEEQNIPSPAENTPEKQTINAEIYVM